MIRDTGQVAPSPHNAAISRSSCSFFTSVRRFAEDVIAPKSREMDESEVMDPAIITGLFENGVSG